VSGRRNERLAEEIRDEVASLIARGLKDPRVGFVTVTRVGLTPDLRIAHVNVGVLGDAAERAKTLTGLRQAAGFLRRELGRRIRVRHVPELQFHYDEGLDAADRVAQLLAENPPRPEGGEPPPEGARDAAGLGKDAERVEGSGPDDEGGGPGPSA
jgi:ribosome-binding factor A